MDRLVDFAQELNNPQYLTVAHSCRARLSLLRGGLEPAVQWARSVNETPVPSALFIWLEVPSIAQARVLIAARKITPAEHLPEAQRRQSPASGCSGQRPKYPDPPLIKQ
jgi:hypothetical protein